METMKYTNVSGTTSMAVSGGTTNHVDEVDSLFISSCWQNSNSNSIQNDFMDTNKLMLEGGISNLGSDKLLLGSPMSQEDEDLENKPTMDTLDNLLLGTQSIATNSLAELKPLPPFTGYTANLSINGIQGHHYHTISQRIPEENNNTYNSYNEQNIVSSSTCNATADSAGDATGKTHMYSVDEVVKLGYGGCNPDSVSGAMKFEDCGGQQPQAAADSVTHIKTEIAEYDITSIEDIAAIIGSAIADTTVPNNSNADNDHAADSRDSWMDLDAWIDGACVDQPKSLIISQDGLSEFVIPNNGQDFGKSQQVQYQSKQQQQQQHQQQGGSSTLQTLLTHGFTCMPLLQNRLENGPPVKQEASSTNYASEMISTSSPPANVVSTTDNLLLTVNGRFMPQYNIHNMADDPLGQNYPHTTSTTTSSPKKPRSRTQKQKQQQQAATSTVFPTEQTLGMLGKEKPVHRCSICNRGFLNKSNIKVHLRTHTGEKPFRCDTCAKAFRQKAHLLKHQQIHKRIGRD